MFELVISQLQLQFIVVFRVESTCRDVIEILGSLLDDLYI